MAFSEQSLAQARQQGYSDDEIFDHIARSDERFSVAKQQGYSLDDIASHLKQKEGGVNYEDATSQSGQGPLDNRNEQAGSGEVQAGSTEGVQADSMLPAEDQSQFRSDEQARVTTGVPQGGELIEGQTKDAQGGIQRQEEGQGIRSQVSTGNEAQVIAPQQAVMQAAPFGAEGVQPTPAKSFVEKITEDPKSAIISGVATAAEAGIPLLAGSVAASVLTPLATAAAIETGPAAPFIGAGAGLTAFAGVSDITRRIVQKTEEALGISSPIKEAQSKQPEIAKAAEIATMTPFLVQSGAGLLKAAATGTVEAAIKGGSLAAGAAKEVGKRLAAGGAAGTIYEAGIRYPAEKAIQMVAGGEEPQKPTLESTAESALMMAALSGAGEEVIKNAGLPETAKIASEIAPDDAIVKKFEETIPTELPQESVPTEVKSAEAPAEAQPTKPSEAKIAEAGGLPPLERKPVEPETTVETKEGVAPREGEGQKEVAAPEPFVSEPASKEKIAESNEAVSLIEQQNKNIESNVKFAPPEIPTLKDARAADDLIAKKGHSLTISGGSKEGKILDRNASKKEFEKVGYERQQVEIPEDFNKKVSDTYGPSISNVKSLESINWLGAHFNGGLAISPRLKESDRGRVLAHEFGHASHSLLGDKINKNPEVLNELKKIEQELYPGLRDKVSTAPNADIKFFNYLLSPEELIAEFNVNRIINPERANQVSPVLSSLLESVQADRNLVKDRKTFPTGLGSIGESKKRIKVEDLSERKDSDKIRENFSPSRWAVELKRDLIGGIDYSTTIDISLAKKAGTSKQIIKKLVEDYANDKAYELIKKSHPDIFEQPAEAPAEAQPTKPSEAKIAEAGGLPPLERKPVEPETAVKIEEGVAPREGEGEEGQVAPLAEKEEIPRKRIGPGAAGIREFELRDIQQGAEIIKGYKDQNNSVLPYEDWKRNFESTLSYEGKYTEGQLKEFYDQSVSVANEAAKGKPIPEAIQQLDIPIAKTGSTTALTNAKIDEDRVNRGRPKLMGIARKDWGTAWEEAVYQIDQDSSVQDRLITELSKKPRAVNDTEGALLVHRLITKKNEYENLIDRLEKGGLTSEEQADLRNKIVVLDDQIYGLEALGKSVGTETARGLNFRKAIIANDYSLEGMRTKIRAAKNGEKLTPAEEEKIKQLHDLIETGEEESERIQNGEKEKFSKEDTRDFIESAKRGSRQRKEKETPDQSLARLKDVAKSRMEDYPKLASTIRKIAISFVDKGITEREPLLDAVHGFLKDEVGMSDSWTKQETSDAICQYGIFRTLSKNATMEAFRRINGQLLELGKRADIVAGEAPKKTGMERAKPDVEARKIARENRKLIKKYNIKTEDPETQLAGALEGIKNKLKNEIEDLSLRIKTGEQAPSKEGSPSDSEIASLKELRSSLKAQFEIMYGKPEKAAPTYDEQVTAAERAYEKLIEKKKEILANQGVTDLTPAKPEVTSPKIEKQKAEIQELNSELKALRSADSARNEEIKKNQLGQRIEQLKKKIAGEVEEKGGEAYGPESKEVTNLKKEIESLQQTLAEMNPKKSPQEKEIERLQAAIDDVNDRIASGEKVAPTAKKEPLTEYAKKLREDLEMARKQLKEVTRTEPKSEEQKKIDSINRQIEQKKKQLSEKSVLQKKEKYDVASLERSEAVKELQSLRDQIKSEDWYIASRQQAAIDSYVARQNKVANEYLRRIEEQDFAPRQKTERVLNSRELEAQANTEKAKAKFQKELALYNYKNRTKEQKVLDFIVNFSRAMLLSHITTLTKLTAASVEIASLKPLKATAGYAWKLLPPVKEIAKLAPTEGGGKPSEDVRLFVKGIVEGIKDFPQVVKMGQSKIDAMVKEKTQISNSVLEYFGHLHKAMKNPVFTGEFKTSLNRYLNWMEKQGMDIYDPVNQKTAMDAAYKNAQRSIFSEDNSIVNYINTAISVGKRSNNRAVRYSAYALQFGLPIVKIPTNIIKQVFESQLGTGIAAAKITKAMIKGIDTLSPMEADTIMRQLKVGSIGLAMFALGAMRPDMFGGLHLAGITEEDEDLPTGGANILGVKVPKVFFDNPILIAAQVGATVRKYWDAKAGEYGYKGEEAVDFAMAMATAEFELVKETPLLSLPKNIEQTMNIERTPENLGGLIADRIPGPIQDLAKALDTEEDGALPSIKALIGINKDIIKRKPDGSPPERFLQTIQKNLPYFRKQVPEK
jgi:hypothetical protein